eukprot:3483029-Prymnesium_polylepis.1
MRPCAIDGGGVASLAAGATTWSCPTTRTEQHSVQGMGRVSDEQMHARQPLDLTGSLAAGGASVALAVPGPSRARCAVALARVCRAAARTSSIVSRGSQTPGVLAWTRPSHRRSSLSTSDARAAGGTPAPASVPYMCCESLRPE